MLRCSVCAVPAARFRCFGGFVAHAWLPCPRTAGAGDEPRLPGAAMSSRLITRHHTAQPGGARDPGAVLGRVVGHHPPKFWSFRRRAARHGALPRRVPPQQQVLRGAGGLPVACRQAARRRVPGRLRRDERAVPRTGHRAARRSRPIRQPRPRVQSSRASTAWTARSSVRPPPRSTSSSAYDVSRHDRERHAVHRPLRHRGGHHDCVPAHRRDRLDQPGDRGARHQRSAHRHGGRAVRRDPGARTSTTTSRTG